MWIAKNNNDDIRLFNDKPEKRKLYDWSSETRWVERFCFYGNIITVNDISFELLNMLNEDEPIEVVFTIKK